MRGQDERGRSTVMLPDARARPTAFVGRQQLVSEVRALLSSAGARLVTLTGAGGVGKTRLARELAVGLAAAFPDGVFQVSLASVRDPELVATCIVQALCLPQVPGRAALDGAAHQLASKRALLVLDGFGHLSAAAPRVAQLLASCPQLVVLVTSRVALEVRFEREIAVAPMHLLPDHSPLASGALPESEAAQLLVERARAFDRAFELSLEDAGAVEELCARLDGMPLALELAASRLETLTPQALAAELARRPELQACERHDVADRREHTMRAAIAWRHDLLDGDLQALFRRAAVFAGGFGMEAARDVLAAPDWPSERVVFGLESLARGGLLVRETMNGETRLQMHESLREYGLEQLRARAESAAVRAAHASHFVALTERLSPHWMSAQQRDAIQRLLPDLDNVRAALDFALETRDTVSASRMLQALSWLWISRCLFEEGRVMTARARAVGAQQPNAREHGLVLDVAGWLAMFHGDYPQALRHSERALVIFEQVGTPSDIARAKLTRGITGTALGRSSESLALLTDALCRYRELAEPYGTALSLIALGEGARGAGDDASARPRYEEALSIMRGIGNVYWPGQLLQHLAHFQLRNGDHRAAARLLAEALELGREYQYPMVMNLYVAAMGAVAVARGRPRDAARLFGAASAALQQLGASFEPPSQQEFERNMAAARSSLGDEVFEAAFAQGSHFSVDEAIAFTQPLRA